MPFVFKFPDVKFAGQKVLLYKTRLLTSHSDPLCFSLDNTFYSPLGAGREELIQPVQVASLATGVQVPGPRSLAAYIYALYSIK
jgi:hypothetical protein